MSELAELLPGIAAVITSISGGIIGILAITRGSKRERKKAARGAIDRVLGDDDEDQDDRHDAVEELLDELQRRYRPADDDGEGGES